MKATLFEYRHQTLLHLLLVGLAVLSYLADPLDIVWAIVQHHSDSTFLERVVFGFGAAMLLVSAALETWTHAHPQAKQSFLRLSRILLASAVGLLLPVSGALLLLAGEAILVARLYLRDQESSPVFRSAGSWTRAFRTSASKWGLAASMILFTWTLQDRIAEIGAGLSCLLWVALNLPPRPTPA